MKRPSRRTRVKQKVALANVGFLNERQRLALVEGVRYCGSPYHKLNPADYGLPETKPRPDKTLCDVARRVDFTEALALLREGVRKGLVSVQWRGQWPQNIWSVDQEGVVYEAQLQNVEAGEYHGYPMTLDMEFAEHVREAWRQR